MPKDTNEANKEKILYKEFSYLLNGMCFDVHNSLGPYYREKQYADAVENEFKKKNINYKREFPIPLTTDKGVVSNKVDFFVENKILLDVKAKRIITKEDYYQMQRYLQASGQKLGLLVNFQNRYLQIKRIIRLDK